MKGRAETKKMKEENGKENEGRVKKVWRESEREREKDRGRKRKSHTSGIPASSFGHFKAGGKKLWLQADERKTKEERNTFITQVRTSTTWFSATTEAAGE